MISEVINPELSEEIDYVCRLCSRWVRYDYCGLCNCAMIVAVSFLHPFTGHRKMFEVGFSLNPPLYSCTTSTAVLLVLLYY